MSARSSVYQNKPSFDSRGLLLCLLACFGVNSFADSSNTLNAVGSNPAGPVVGVTNERSSGKLTSALPQWGLYPLEHELTLQAEGMTLTPSHVRTAVLINGVRRREFNINETAIRIPKAFTNGANSVTVVARDRQERLVEYTGHYWAGSNTLKIDVLSRQGTLVPAQIKMLWSADERLAITLSATDSGRINSLPTGVYFIQAQANDGEQGVALVNVHKKNARVTIPIKRAGYSQWSARDYGLLSRFQNWETANDIHLVSPPKLERSLKN